MAPAPANSKEPEKNVAPKKAGYTPLESLDADAAPPPRWVLPAIMITVLTIGGWFIIQNLWETSKLEDCTMSGRKNCVAPIDTSQMGK